MLPVTFGAFIFSRILLPKFNFTDLARTQSLERRGALYGICVAALSLVSLGLIMTVVGVFVEPTNLAMILLTPLSFALLGSIATLGIPYIVGIVIGIWSAHYEFRQSAQ
jgi:hypothetical protein